jgi:hypothetical protein
MGVFPPLWQANFRAAAVMNEQGRLAAGQEVEVKITPFVIDPWPRDLRYSFSFSWLTVILGFGALP